MLGKGGAVPAEQGRKVAGRYADEVGGVGQCSGAEVIAHAAQRLGVVRILHLLEGSYAAVQGGQQSKSGGARREGGERRGGQLPQGTQGLGTDGDRGAGGQQDRGAAFLQAEGDGDVRVFVRNLNGIVTVMRSDEQLARNKAFRNFPSLRRISPARQTEISTISSPGERCQLPRLQL